MLNGMNFDSFFLCKFHPTLGTFSLQKNYSGKKPPVSMKNSFPARICIGRANTKAR